MTPENQALSITNGQNTRLTTYPGNHQNVVVNWELFLGRQRWLSDTFLGQLGLDIGTTGSTTLNGTILDHVNSINGYYTYSYQVKHTYVAVKGKLLAEVNY